MRAFLRIGFTGLSALTASLLTSTVGWAEPTEGGYAVDRQIDLMAPATDHMQHIHDFHQFLMVIITGITLFVLGLLLWVMVRYNAKANPKPSNWSHNTLIEVIWTIVPVIILGLIAIRSIPLLYEGEVIPGTPDITVKAIGHQWNWSYEYPDQGVEIELAEAASDEEAKAADEPRLLAVKEGGRVVVPVNKVVRVLVTSTDVIHSWTIPAFGLKVDGVPGRLNQTWFKANREGVFYGQCSELCGVRHAYMPIVVEVVSQEKFDEWVANKKKSAQLSGASSALASR
ncbi:MAG: cytochrome c oxidase subunit II [Micropepsaceae bacterium]